jgi:hypothetical protein
MSNAYALFPHCFTCSKETLAGVRISRARFVEIANRCPVHWTLQSEVCMPTRLRS